MLQKILKPKGNILMLSLFVLFASALLGVLVSLAMRDFLKYSTESAHYHQANALARAASELWFMLIGESKAGFDFTWSGETLITQNISCPIEKRDWKCWFEQDFSLEIKGLKSQISANLQPGQSLTLPMFYHTINRWQVNTPIPWKENPSWVNPITGKLTISRAKEDDSQETKIEEWNNSFNNWWNATSYYIISNIDRDDSQQIKLQGMHLFDWNFTMTVQGKYGDKEVSKIYNLKQALPEFLQSDNYLTSPS